MVVEPPRLRWLLLRKKGKSVKFLVKENLKSLLVSRLLEEVQRAAQLRRRQLVLDYHHQARQLVRCRHQKSPFLTRMQRFTFSTWFVSNSLLCLLIKSHWVWSGIQTIAITSSCTSSISNCRWLILLRCSNSTGSADACNACWLWSKFTLFYRA